MIYTCGNTKSYEQYFKEEKYPKKKGKDLDGGYVGGSVWKTRQEAQQHCPINYSVYGVDADWNNDTETIPNQTWNNLLIDALLIKL